MAAPAAADDAAKKGPVTIAEAERYGELCKVRQMQKKLEELSQTAKTKGISVDQELQNRGMNDTWEFIESCEQLPLSCDLMDLSELGSGFPLYFQFLQFLGFMLTLMLVIQSPCMAANSGYGHLDTWQADLTKEEAQWCSTCTGDNKGVVGVGSRKVSDTYGQQCGAHDISGCNEYSETDLEGSKKGLWCCQSWCYVDSRCPAPFAAPSSESEEVFYSYTACPDDPNSMKTCPWTLNITYGKKGKSEAKTSMIEKNNLPFGGLTPGNAGNPKMGYGISGELHGLINLVVVGIFCASLAFQKARIRFTDSAVDAETTQPDDFAILCSGLPETATDEASIAEFWKNNAVKDKQVEIVKVVIGWNLEEFNKLNDEKKKLIQTRFKLITENDLPADHDQVKKIVARIVEIQTQLNSTGPQMASRMTSTGINIVIFRHQTDHRECLNRWTGFWPRFSGHEKGCLFGLCKGDRLPRWCDGAGREVAQIMVKRADNPMDINWENLGRTSQERKARFVENTFFMAILIGVAFGLIVLINLWEEDMMEESVNEETGITEMKPSKALVVVPSLLVCLLNVILNMSARRLAGREYFNSKTETEASTILKMSTSLIVTTAGVLLLLKTVKDGSINWYRQNGLVDAVFYMLLINAIFPPLLARFDMMGVFVRTFRSARKMGEKMEAAPRKQGEMYMKYWEPSEFDTPRRYANALQTFVSCALYQPIMPQVLLVGIFGIVLQYWIDKYMLLRVHKRPEAIEGASSSYAALKITRLWVTLGLPIGIMIFISPVATKEGAMTAYLALGLILAVITAILPDKIQRILLCSWICMSKVDFDEDHSASTIDYYAAQMFWPSTMKYNKTHPLYKTLPETINPENLSPGTGMMSGEDMRKNCKGMTAKVPAADDLGQSMVVTPICIGKGQIHQFGRGARDVVVAKSSVLVSAAASGGYVPGGAVAHTTVQPVSVGGDVETGGYVPGGAVAAPATSYVPGQAVQVVQPVQPVAIGGGHQGPSHHGGGHPVWEFETNHGFHAFDNDCQQYVEKIYQQFKSGQKGPKRQITTKGKKIEVNFEDMEQKVLDGDGNTRKIRRRI